MKKLKNLLFGILSIGLILIGTSVEAKTVNWDDLVAKLKDGKYVENLNNAINNGEDVSYDIDSDDTKFVFTSTVEGKTHTFQLNYDKTNGTVGFDNKATGTYENILAETLMSALWMEDILLAAGDLYGYKESDVVDFIKNGNGKDNLTLDEDGILIIFKSFSYIDENGNEAFDTMLGSFKLDLVNGFGGLVEDTSDCADPEPTPAPETKPTTNPDPVPETTPEEAPAENPSTGDVQIYQIIGGIVVSLVVAVVAIKNLNRKEEII